MSSNVACACSSSRGEEEVSLSPTGASSSRPTPCCSSSSSSNDSPPLPAGSHSVRGSSPLVNRMHDVVSSQSRSPSSNPSREGLQSPNTSLSSSSSDSMRSLRAIGITAPVGPHTLSAQLASAVSTACFYPFDLLKTRFMSQDGTRVRQHNGMTYRSVRHAMTTIYREEGGRTLFRGLPVAISGAVIAWGMYMWCYRFLCNATEVTSYVGRSGVSMCASGMSTLLSCPIFLIKSRMQLEEAAGQHKHYTTFRSGLRHTIQTGGVRSLWRGGTLHLWLVFPYCFSIPTYDYLKTRILLYRERSLASADQTDYSLTLFEVAVCSVMTKVFVLFLSHPMIMLRVRLQDQRSLVGPIQYSRVTQSIATVFRTQGVLGMYRGFWTALLHTLPRSVLHYAVYETTLSHLLS